MILGYADDPTAHLTAARAHSERARDRDDSTGLSQMVLAALSVSEGGDLDAALTQARLAGEYRPTCDVTFGVEAAVERYRNNWRMGIEAAQRAIRLSPVIKPWYATTLAGCLYQGGRCREAADHAQAVVDDHPSNLDAHLVLVAALQASGQARRARAAADLIRDRFPDFRRSDLTAGHPFVDTDVVERWATDLAAAGIG